MKSIWKYPCPVLDRFSLDLPEGAEILDFQVQDHTPMLWVLVEPEADTYPVLFRLVGTGHTVDDADRLIYVGTVQADIRTTPLVWHLFIEKEASMSVTLARGGNRG